MDEIKKCPYCGEEIKAVAKKCWHCGEWLDKEVAPSTFVRESEKEALRESQSKCDEKPAVSNERKKQIFNNPSAESKSKGFSSVLKTILFKVIPIVAAINFAISLIIVHANYSYGSWWEDEDVIMLRFVLYFIGGLALYYAIIWGISHHVGSKSNTGKRYSTSTKKYNT